MSHIPKVSFTSQGETIFLSMQEIKYCSSQASYCHIHSTSGKTYTISKNLKHVEECLPSTHFFRIHHSILVNTSKVFKITNEEEAMVLLEDGTSLPLARRRKTDFVRHYINL